MSAQKDPRAVDLRHIHDSFDLQDSEASCRRLVRQLSSEWNLEDDQIKCTPFTEGITNTIIKVTPQLPNQDEEDADRKAVLIRAYGKDTDFIIDRQKELRAHNMLANKQLAAPLLAQFDNGFMCSFIPGDICDAEHFHDQTVYRGIAATLGKWHSTLPISVLIDNPDSIDDPETRPVPNIWTNAQKWIDLLPSDTEELKARNDTFRKELEWFSSEYGNIPGIDGSDYVFSHTDLLCANVVRERVDTKDNNDSERREKGHPVTFIDYEYATTAPPVFDIANFFAEWAGPDGDLSFMPSRSQRTDFIQHYLRSWKSCSGGSEDDISADADRLFDQVEIYRGLPGLYWGIWGMLFKLSDMRNG